MENSPKRTLSPFMIIIPLYVLSGASALIYEIVWARMLGIVVGTAVTAWAAILVAYMGGMALGSLFGGKIADRVNHPLVFFALCEAGIGLYGIASPSILHYFQQFTMILPPWPGMRTGIAVAALIVPTMLMGATFPIISSILLTGSGKPGRDLGFIYSANTAGAIIGTLGVGFVLMPYAGMTASLHTAAAVNLLVAAGAGLSAFIWKHGNREGLPSPAGPEIAPARQVPAWLFPSVLACSGFCAMAFEVLWSRALVFFLTSTTYSFTIVLSVMLAGLAGGGLLSAAIYRTKNNAAVWIAILQLFIGIYGFSSLFFLHGLDSIVHFNEQHVADIWRHWIGVRYAACIMVIFPAALCMGATFPLAVIASCRSLRSAGRSVGALASLNTLGGIAGSLAAAFLLIPIAGIQQSLMIIALANCAAGIAVLILGVKRTPVWIAAGAAAALLAGFVSFNYADRNPMIRYSHIMRGGSSPDSLLSYREDQTASVAVLKSGRDRKLNIDGFNAAGTRHYEYMHLLAHLPVLLSPSPDTVLVICFGSGTTCGTAALYPRVGRVDCAEISPAVIASARYFSDVNYNATTNPKVRIVINDGRDHLLRTRGSYDVITLEPMLPYLASATNLYSSDFYRLCRSRLSAHGVMAQWAPMHVLSTREYRMLIAAFTAVFSHASLWLLGSEAILIGTMDPLQINIDTLAHRMSPQAPHADLVRISLADPARLLSCFLMDGAALKNYTGDVPVITDDRYGLEFSAPHNRVLPISRMWVDNMNELLRHRVSVLPFIEKPTDSMATQIGRCSEASSLIMNAGILNAQGNAFHAFMAADSALRLMPGDTTALMIRQESGNGLLAEAIDNAQTAYGRGDLKATEAACLEALSIDSSCAPVLSILTQVNIDLGRFDEVLKYARKAVAASPGDPAMHTNLAIVYLNLDQPAEAEKTLLDAIVIDRNFGRAYFYLAALYRQSGRIAEAQMAEQRTAELGYRE